MEQMGVSPRPKKMSKGEDMRDVAPAAGGDHSSTGAHHDRGGDNDNAEFAEVVLKKCAQVEKCSFLRDRINPDWQSLLQLSPREAKEGMLQIVGNYVFFCSLVLAGIIGVAYSPVKSEDSPTLAAVYNLMLGVAVIHCTMVGFLGSYMLSQISAIDDEVVHATITKCDAITLMFSFTQQVSCLCLIVTLSIRLWLTDQSTTVKWIGTGLYIFITVAFVVAFFKNQSRAFPVTAQVWTKLNMRCLFNREASAKAVARLANRIRQQQGVVLSSSKHAGKAPPSSSSGRVVIEASETVANTTAGACAGSTKRCDVGEVCVALRQYLASKNNDVLLADQDEFLKYLFHGGCSGSSSDDNNNNYHQQQPPPSSVNIRLVMRIFDQYTEQKLEELLLDECRSSLVQQEEAASSNKPVDYKLGGVVDGNQIKKLVEHC